MSTQYFDKAPPEYAPSDDVTLQLFNRVQAATRQERGDVDEHDVETARMRKFLLYCLTIDYRSNCDFVLTAADCEHFLELHNIISDLEQSHSKTDLTWEERQHLAPYFWKYLHMPCMALAIPVESAVVIIARFVRYLNVWNRYKGRAHGLLYTRGPRVLALKLHMDKNVMIPRLAADAQTRNVLTTRMVEFSRLYFTHIGGINDAVYTDGTENSWHTLSEISYTLNERGLAYDYARNSAIKIVTRAGCMFLDHLSDMASSCMPGLKSRHEVYPKGKMHSDHNGTWKGPEQLPPGTFRTSHLLRYPVPWYHIKGLHLPEFFEHRSGQGRCDQ